MEIRMLVRIAIVLLAVMVLFSLVYNVNSSVAAGSPPMVNATRPENYEEPSAPGAVADAGSGAATPAASGSATNAVPSGNEPLDNDDFRAVDFDIKNKLPSDCFPKDRLTAEDLLPSDAANSRWAQINPAGQGDVKDQNYLTAGYHIGIDTIGQSLRNPSYDLRAEIPNPQQSVSPWMQTTIGPDMNKKSLC